MTSIDDVGATDGACGSESESAQLPPIGDPPAKERIGICCSGGGIRSAAYNLGALQVLREEGVLDEADYVSAVSGGAYIASSFATVASESPQQSLTSNDPPVYAPGSPEERHLRNNSSYMAPHLGGKLHLLTRFVLGMAVQLALIGAIFFVVARFAGWLYGAAYGQLPAADPADAAGAAGAAGAAAAAGELADAGGVLAVPTLVLAAIAAFALIGLVLALIDLLKRPRTEKARAWRERWSRRALWAAGVLALVLIAVPQAILLARTVAVDLDLAAASESGAAAAELVRSVGAGAVGAVVLAAIGNLLVRRGRAIAIAVAGLAGPLAVAALVLWALNAAAAEGPTADQVGVWLAVVLALAIAWPLVDLTQWSLHPFYRRRLASAFFVQRTAEGGKGELSVKELDYAAPLKLSTLERRGQFPELIVCAAANVSDRGRLPPGRAATPFAFSRERVGGPVVGELPTAEYEARADRDVTLPAAVAMSGAAVSPVMGKKSIRAITFLMALTNIRLGVWVPRPRRVDEAAGARRVPLARGRLAGLLRRRPSPAYALKELFAHTSIDDRFLYVTDGGHYDNLGLIELLRRRCTTIYCFDAGGDPAGVYEALGEAVAFARTDLQVDIEIDPDDIVPSPKRRVSERDHVLGSFRYRISPSGMPIGEGGGGGGGGAGGVGRGGGRHGRTGRTGRDGREGAEADEGRSSGQIVYCRSAVTADAPWDVHQYHRKHRRFPNHPTFDQLFDDRRFEAYRALGAHTARKAVATVRAANRSPADQPDSRPADAPRPAASAADRPRR